MRQKSTGNQTSVVPMFTQTPGGWFMPSNGLRQAGWKQLEMLAVCPAHLPQVPTSAAGMARCLINQHLPFCLLQVGTLGQANISFCSGS